MAVIVVQKVGVTRLLRLQPRSITIKNSRVLVKPVLIEFFVLSIQCSERFLEAI